MASRGQAGMADRASGLRNVRNPWTCIISVASVCYVRATKKELEATCTQLNVRSSPTANY